MEKTVDNIKMPPTGLAILALVGPGLVWAGEYIGSGEVILCTRLGSIMGVTILWVPMIAIFLKYWIGLCGARYTVCVGEGMMDMFSRMPGPRNWAIWVVLVGQFSAGAVSIGALASASAAFIHALWPVDQVMIGWGVSLICVLIVWSGKFDPLKYVTSALVLIMVIGVIYVAVQVAPSLSELMVGLFGFGLPEVPTWALDSGAAGKNVWAEVLPVMGWAAGGFASQVWYSYWILESGFGMASQGGFGKAAGEKELSEMSVETARKLKGWSHVVYADATTAVIIGMVVTGSFLVAGAGVLGKLHLAPNGPQVAIQLSEIFGKFWGRTGAILFLLAGIAALVSTNLVQFAGWPRIMSDCARILFPRSVEKFPPQRVRRIFVLIFLTSNMLIINTFGVQPIMLVKVGAILDGLLLTPVQAILVGWALFAIMPCLLSRDAARTLKASPVLAVGLAIAALVFSYFAVVKIPTILY